MIKLLKNKLFISMFLLVVCVCITSSCFAYSSDTATSPHKREQVINKYFELGGTKEVNNMGYFSSSWNNHFQAIFVESSDVVFVKVYTISYNRIYFYDVNGNNISCNYILLDCYHPSISHEWSLKEATCEVGGYINTFGNFTDDTNLSIYDYQTNELYYEGSYTKSNTEKKIVYEITYDENNKTARVSASIKNGVAGDRLYYSTLGLRVTGKLMNPIEIQQSELTSIKVTKNDLIHFQALDSDGNIIDTVVVNVNKLDVFDSKNLEVKVVSDFYDRSIYAPFLGSTYTDVTGTLLNGNSWYYDLECKLDFSNCIKDNESWVFQHNSRNFELSSDYFSVVSGDTIRISTDSKDFTGYIIYRITNKETGQVVCIKKITLTGSGSGTNITGSTIYDSEDDFNNNVNGKSDFSGVINDNPYNSDSSTDTITSIIKGNNDILATINYLLGLFPTWLTGPILFFLSSIVVIAIIKKIIS